MVAPGEIPGRNMDWSGVWEKIVWNRVMYFGILHCLAAWGLTKVRECTWPTLLYALALWQITAIGLSAGAHRLWSHRSYTAKWPVRFFLMIAHTCSMTGPLLQWCKEHRCHHRHVDGPCDPHNASRGFFFAHFGWLLIEYEPELVEALSKVDVSDLEQDHIVQFQAIGGNLFGLFMGLGVCSLIPCLWGASLLQGFLVAGCLRATIVYHLTFCVNSFAHLYGTRPYDPTSFAAENPVVSFVAVGEGWHNWHHKYPFDYASSEFGIFSHYNPTKLFIDTCAKLGLVTGRRRALSIWRSEVRS